MSPDTSRFAEASPRDIATYLSSIGWAQPAEQPAWTQASLWVHTTNEGTELLVPTQREFGDYSRLVYEVCEAIADMRGTEPLRILAEIANVSFDTVRLRAQIGSSDYSIPLTDGVALVEQAKAMLSAAAAAAVEPRRNYPSRKPPAAEHYMSSLRLGQTERGSYVVAVLSPVGYGDGASDREEVEEVDGDVEQSSEPAVLFGEPPAASDEASKPVRQVAGRQVVETLLEAVDSAENAAGEFLRTQDLESFDNAVQKGVSANLCQSLADIKKVMDTSVGLSVSWSPRRAPEEAVAQLGSERLLRSDTREIMEMAAKHLRQEDQPQPVRVSGPVVSLKRKEGQLVGVATMIGELRGRARTIQISLPLEQYLLAVRAHQRSRTLSVTGLPRERPKYVELVSPADVAVE